MNKLLVTMAPAMEAFTSMYSPARRAVRAMTSSVRFPSVALSRPPAASPVLAATDFVAWLNSAASGTIARTDSRNRRVWESGHSLSPARTMGTKISSHSSGLCRISFSNRFMSAPRLWPVRKTPLVRLRTAGNAATEFQAVCHGKAPEITSLMAPIWIRRVGSAQRWPDVRIEN